MANKKISDLTETTSPAGTAEVELNVAGVSRRADLADIIKEINDTSRDHQYVIAVSELAADRTITLPLLTANDTFVFAAFAQTLTNKRIDKRVASTTDDATAEIDCDSYDEYYLTAIANNTTISITGTPTAGQTIFIGLKDAGVSKTLTWTSITGLGVTLPTATTASKQHIIGLKYIASAWRAIAVAVES